MTGDPGRRAPFAYRLHGYRLISDTDLGEVAPRDDEPEVPVAAEITVVRGEDRVNPEDDAPDGEVIARLRDEQRNTYYTFARSDRELTLRFHGALDVVCDRGLNTAMVHLHPGFDPDIVGVVLPGTLMATRLIMDGRLVLHASALETETGVIAFLGKPGMGKSTLAGLGLVAGYRLITDDVLRADLGQDVVRVWPGAREVRLRESAVSVAGLAPGNSRGTADGRLALGDQAVRTTVGPGHQHLPLRACVVPYPRRDRDTIAVSRLGAFEALTQLMGFPRVTGWCHEETMAAQFQALGDLCERVPVFAADLPWGPPFDPGTIPTLFELIESCLAADPTR